VYENALAAGIALIAASAEPADGDAVTNRKIIDARTEFGYRSGDFMSRRQRPRHARKLTCHKMSVSAANAAGADLDACLAPARCRCFDLGQLQWRACGLYVNRFVLRHLLSSLAAVR
jgi:hypothetical protein